MSLPSKDRQIMITFNSLTDRMSRAGLARRSAVEILDNESQLSEVGRMVSSDLKQLKHSGFDDPISELYRYGLEHHSEPTDTGPQTPYSLTVILAEFNTLIWGYKMATGVLKDHPADLGHTTPYRNGESRDGNQLTPYEQRHGLNTAGKWSKHTKDKLKSLGLL